ncbi:MAG: hypothetical protein ACOC2E_07900 [Bacteroidota bacterium]
MFKDSVITAQQKKRELIVFLICLAAAFIFNIVGIMMFKTPAIEIFTQFHYVLLVAVVFYVITGIFRLIWLGFRMILAKNH